MSTSILPCLWFDREAQQAVKFYTSVFKNSKTGTIVHYSEGSMMPEGTIMTIKFRLAGLDFIAMNGGPYFKFTPAISFFVGCKNLQEFDELWKKLSQGGRALIEPEVMMPHFEKYGSIQDKYGLSWQLGICGIPQYITPYLTFEGELNGKAEEAINLYRSIFKTSTLDSMIKYHKIENEIDGSVQHATFTLNGQEFMAADSGLNHDFSFTEAVSFYVYCRTQSEIDYYWNKLSKGGMKGQCGWLKDRFKVSWQIVPEVLEKMMSDKDPEKVKRVTKAFLKMKKLNIKALELAFDHIN